MIYIEYYIWILWTLFNLVTGYFLTLRSRWTSDQHMLTFFPVYIISVGKNSPANKNTEAIFLKIHQLVPFQSCISIVNRIINITKKTLLRHCRLYHRLYYPILDQYRIDYFYLYCDTASGILILKHFRLYSYTKSLSRKLEYISEGNIQAN